MRFAFFGSSLVSSYWNEACTYYRGLIRCLHERGHEVTFYEPISYGRQEHRDIDDPDYARVVIYPAEAEGDVLAAVESARGCADVVIKCSGVGVHDELLDGLDERRARSVGEAARARVLAEHTYMHRAEQVEAILAGAAV